MRTLDNIKETILNALIAGMSYADALILSMADEQQIATLDNDILFQAQCKQASKTLELKLLKTLDDVIDIQTGKGKDHAVTWLLSKINPSRYGGGDDNSASNVGTIVINTKPVDISDPDTAVEVFDGTKQL
jgi:hypothetical protein